MNVNVDYILVISMLQEYTDLTKASWELAQDAQKHIKNRIGNFQGNVYPSLILASSYGKKAEATTGFIARFSVANDKEAEAVKSAATIGLSGYTSSLSPIGDVWYEMSIFDKNLFEVKDKWLEYNESSRKNIDIQSFFSPFIYQDGDKVKLLGLVKPDNTREACKRFYLQLLRREFPNQETIYKKVENY